MINFIHMLTVLFIGLKLTDNIDWSWWIVFSPSLAWVGLIVVLFATAVFLTWKDA